MSTGTLEQQLLMEKQDRELVTDVLNLLKEKTYRTDICTDNSKPLTAEKALDILDKAFKTIEDTALSQNILELKL